MFDRTGKLQLGQLPDHRTRPGLGPVVYVVRGEDDKTLVYDFAYQTGTVTVDDIVVEPSEIVRLDQVPVYDVIQTGALWPMARKGEMSFKVPAIIEAYRRLPAGENACVLFINTTFDFVTTTRKVLRTRNTDFEKVPIVQRPAYCRDLLARRIPPVKERLKAVD